MECFEVLPKNRPPVARLRYTNSRGQVHTTMTPLVKFTDGVPPSLRYTPAKS
jgi:hypothetical protein